MKQRFVAGLNFNEGKGMKSLMNSNVYSCDLIYIKHLSAKCLSLHKGILSPKTFHEKNSANILLSENESLCKLEKEYIAQLVFSQTYHRNTRRYWNMSIKFQSLLEYSL